MRCNVCSEPVEMVKSEGGTQSNDKFRETYRCASGHRGTIRGTVGDSPSKWDKTGAVFNV